jgi:hypothetical protein
MRATGARGMGEMGEETGMAETAPPKTREVLVAVMAERRTMAMSAAAWSPSAMWVHQGEGARHSSRRNGYPQYFRTGNEDTSWEK